MAPNSPEPRPPVNILMVDDHPPNLMALEATLEPLGESLVRARSGREALAEVEKREFALILLDVRMADMDGFETARHIRQHARARETPIIFLTAIHTETHYARQGLSLGAVDYIYKPFDPDLLRDKVRSFVALHRERRARQVAEAALKTKDLILGVLGHDLRSPVTAICASADLLLRDEEAVDRREALTRINSSARRMDRMVRALVDYARSYLGDRMPVHDAPARMDDICRRVAADVLVSHPDRNIVVSVDGDVEGRWDSDRVEQAITNLVVNAADHARGDVRIEVAGHSDEVVVAVTNDGGRFPAALRASLFTPFRKGDAGDRGLGLGLFIVREIVVAHGGSVTLASGADEALTRFVTRWPRRSATMRP
ncbi:MAG: hybrid sensor histidine kinase/response regulator [Myxococcales bacterium]|nr:hybrid sensor histidine kinase/response regulator [Myxococcales bacterium]